MKSLEQQLSELAPTWRKLLISLKADIGDDYRASDDPDDSVPGMCVTIGFTPETEDRDYSWGYQTGDNSFTGGAYCHPHWAVISLYRRSKTDDLVEDICDQLAELIIA